MSLSVWQRNIVTEAGDVIPDAEIEVFFAGSSSKPSLFSDPDGNSSLTNPFNADTNGFARFYVSGGRYDVSVNGTVLWEDVALGTTQGRDTGTGANEVPTNSDLGTASLADTGTAPSEVPTNDILRDEYDFETMPLVDGNPIIARGSNSDGEWTVFADGTQIARFLDIDSYDTTLAAGEIFTTERQTYTVPVPFANELVAISDASRRVGGTAVWGECPTGDGSSGTTTIEARGYSHSSRGTIRHGYQAIGRAF